MKQIKLTAWLVVLVIMGSCAVSHPNEKIIVGTWRPVKVEKVVDSSALEAAAALNPTAASRPAGAKPGEARPARGGDGGSRKEAELNRLLQLEQRSTMEIYPDKTAVKNFHHKPINATWKMKGKGKKILAKNVETKHTFVIEILEISKERMVVLQHTPAGDLKIEYERQFDAN